MRNKLFFAAFASILVGTSAHAQSGVTLYGLIDEGFNYTTNSGGHSGYQMLSGDTAGSRWGLKGAEDLGNGLSAVFRVRGRRSTAKALGNMPQEASRRNSTMQTWLDRQAYRAEEIQMVYRLAMTHTF